MSDLLAGVRVIESAMLFNGDTVGAHLGDLGADVIKVEGPPVGDYLRHFLGQVAPGYSPAHIQINRNKRSIGLDLRSDAGREVFWRLLATADVFVDGNAADACEKLGIGYEAQRAHKPDIVYCQYSGYGATGPYSAIPTHGQMMDALAGAMPMAMGDDGFMHPAPHAGPLSGMNTGGEGTAAGAIHAAFHVAAALVQRSRTGAGRVHRHRRHRRRDLAGVDRRHVRAQRPPHRRSFVAPRSLRRRVDRRLLPVLRVQRRPHHPVLLHRAEVLEELLQGGRASRSGRAQRRRERRLTGRLRRRADRAAARAAGDLPHPDARRVDRDRRPPRRRHGSRTPVGARGDRRPAPRGSRDVPHRRPSRRPASTRS